MSLATPSQVSKMNKKWQAMGEKGGEIKRTNKMNKMNTKLSLIECNGAHEITIYFLSAGQKAKRSNRLGEGKRKQKGG